MKKRYWAAARGDGHQPRRPFHLPALREPLDLADAHPQPGCRLPLPDSPLYHLPGDQRPIHSRRIIFTNSSATVPRSRKGNLLEWDKEDITALG